MFIGLFGGTFNPIHNGHLHIARSVYNALKLDRIIFIPTGDPPHKPLTSLAPAHHRLEMVKRAIAPFPHFTASDHEIAICRGVIQCRHRHTFQIRMSRGNRVGVYCRAGCLSRFFELEKGGAFADPVSFYRLFQTGIHLHTTAIPFVLSFYTAISFTKPGPTGHHPSGYFAFFREIHFPLSSTAERGLGLDDSRTPAPWPSRKPLVAAHRGVLYNSAPIVPMARITHPKPPLSLEQAVFIAQAAQEKQAEEVLVLEVGAMTSIADYFVFASGDSERQVRGIASFIEKSMSTRYKTTPDIEGKETANWMLLDYGDIIVHIFKSDVRKYYALEKMWADAPQIPIPEISQPFPQAVRASRANPNAKVAPL